MTQDDVSRGQITCLLRTLPLVDVPIVPFVIPSLKDRSLFMGSGIKSVFNKISVLALKQVQTAHSPSTGEFGYSTPSGILFHEVS